MTKLFCTVLFLFATVAFAANATATSLESEIQRAQSLSSKAKTLSQSIDANNTNLNKSDKTEAIENYNEAITIYKKLITNFKQLTKREEKRLGSARALKNSKWKFLKANELKCTIALAWTKYHLALISDIKTKNNLLIEARNTFRKFSENGFTNDEITANCFLGRTLCLYELGQFNRAARLLASGIISPLNTDFEYFKKITTLRIEVCKKTNSPLQLEQYAWQYFDIMPANHTLDTLDMQIALAQFEALTHLAKSNSFNPYYETYQQRLNEAALILVTHGNDWKQKALAIAQNTQVFIPALTYEEARSEYKEQKYETALSLTEKIIENQTICPAEQLYKTKHLQICCLYKLNRYESAFYLGKDLLSQPLPSSIISDLINTTFESGLNSLTQKPEITRDFEKVYALVAKEYPEYITAPNLRNTKARALLNTKRYNRIPELYRNLRTELNTSEKSILAYAHLGIAKKENNQNEKRKQLAICNNILTNSNLSKTQQQQIAIELIKALLNLKTPDYKTAEQIINTLNQSALENRELLPVQLLITVRKGNIKKSDTILDSIFENKVDSPTTTKALIAAASLYENQLSTSPAEKSARLTLTKIYQHLLDSSNLANSITATNRNIITKQLADNLFELGETQKALDYYKTLITRETFQNNSAILYNLAMGSQQITEYAPAASYWSLLAKGLSKNDPRWIEANLQLINCRLKNGQTEIAVRLYKLFILRHNKKLDENWLIKFNTLKTELKL